MTHNIQEIETAIGLLSLREDNILILHLKEGIEITEDNTKEIISSVNQLTDKKLPLIIIAGSHSLSHYAQVHLSSTQVISKIAMVLEREITRQMYQFLTTTFEPVYEMRIFQGFDEALNWVKTDCILN